MDSALPVFVPPLAALIIAVMAAGLAWSVATPLVRAAASPTLPERLLRWSGQHRAVAALAYAPLLFAGRHVVWALPLAWLGLQITTHRVRRRVYGDTWSFAAQAWWNARVFAVVPGWWLALAFAPAAMLYADASTPAVAAVGAALAAWLVFHNAVVCAVLGARPIDAPALRDAFEPVLARAAIPRPRLVHAGPRGGTQVNAFALGALGGDVVLFLDGLLAETTPAEAAAVLAHEIGHLEDFAARRWQVYAPAPLFVAGGVLIAIAAGPMGAPDWVGLVWALVVIATLLAKLVRSQQRETDSDRRAVELCGDGEALVRALIVIHERARLPRRFHPDFARQATHPSLARRIQAIRAIAGVAPAAIQPRAFAGDGQANAVVFGAERLVFASLGDDAPDPGDLGDLAGIVERARHVDALPYDELSSLHVEPRRAGGATLVATDRRGVTRRLPIADRDVAEVQAMLDAVDPRLGPPVLRTGEPRMLGRLVALAALLVALPAFAWAVMLAALVTLVRPVAPLLLALGAGLGMAAASHPSQPRTLWQTVAIAVVGASAAVLAIQQWRRDAADRGRFAWDAVLVAGVLVLGAAAAVPTWFIVALGHGDPERLHVAARAFGGAATAWAAVGGLCLAMPRRLPRIASVAALALAAAIAGLGSNAFRDRAVPDPLIAGAPALAVDELAAAPDGRVLLPGAHVSLGLAPDAQHVVLAAAGARYPTGRYTVAGFDGWRRTIEADAVRFVDGGVLLLARWDRRTLRLWTEPVRDATPRWTLTIADASIGGAIDVDASGRWRVEPSIDPEAPEAWERFEGRIGDAAFRRVAAPAAEAAGPIRPETGIAGSGARISVRRRFTGRVPWFAAMVPELAWRSVLERSGGAADGVLADSRLAVDCSGPSLATSLATCLATTGDETFVWDVDADGGALTPRAVTQGRILLAHPQQGPSPVVWRDGDLLMLWRGTSRAVHLASGDGAPRAHGAAYAAGHLVTLARVEDHDEVVRYRLAPPR